MYRLYVHRDAERDLNQLWQTSKAATAAARIVALLEDLQGNQDLLDRLTQHDFGVGRSEPFHVSKWFEHWNKGKDLWRLKLWDLEAVGLKYRVVYAYTPGIRQYNILAIAPRSFGYAEDHPLTQRILRAYDNL